MDVRIYYEDTDAGGVVYHAKYLHYFERARTEFMRGHGLSVREMHDAGLMFPVVHIDISFRSPGYLDDLLEVESRILQVRNSAFMMGQKVLRKEDGKLLVDAKVTLASVDEGMKSKRLPQELKDRLIALMPEEAEK